MNIFLQIIGAAFTGAAVTMAAVAASDPQAVTDKNKIGPLAITGAIIGVGGLLKKSPISPPAPVVSHKDLAPVAPSDAAK
jgi:hypothetical protein